MATDWDNFFKIEKDSPTAWNATKGYYPGASVSSDLFSRDEKMIIDAAKKHGFTLFKNNHSIHFEIIACK